MPWMQQHTSPESHSQSSLQHSQHLSSVHQPATSYLADNIRSNDIHPAASANATAMSTSTNFLANLSSIRPQNHASTSYTATQQHSNQHQQQQHAQNHLTNQKQSQLWQQQQSNYLEANKMMQPNDSPGSWQQPQQQQQQLLAKTNSLMYQPPTAGTPHSWQQPELQAAAVQQQQHQPTAASYGNYYVQQPQLQPQPQLPLPQQPQQTLQQQSHYFQQQQFAAATYGQPSLPQQHNQQTLLQQTRQPPQQQQPQQQQPQQQQPQQQQPQQQQPHQQQPQLQQPQLQQPQLQQPQLQQPQLQQPQLLQPLQPQLQQQLQQQQQQQQQEQQQEQQPSHQPPLQPHPTQQLQQQQLLQIDNDSNIRNGNNNNNNNTTNNNSSHNSGNKTDGWSDWDWNDNVSLSSGNDLQLQSIAKAPPHQQQPQHQSHPLILDQANNLNASIIEESFGSQRSNNWQWGADASDDSPNANSLETQTVAPPAASMPLNTPQVLPMANVTESLHHQQQQPQQLNSYQVPQQPLAATVGAVQPPPPTTRQLAEVTNDTYNNIGATASGALSNIASSVYLSQAKPVARPPRQYASPPGGSTPVETPENALTPPQGFENDAAPPPAMSPPAELLPSVPGPAARGNPFKRSGAAQHHRANLLPTTATPSATLGASTSNYGVPPPPADFANPAECVVLEPDNSEHENKEVISGSAVPVTMIYAQSMASVPPPNDERAQYLQTSHLSENPDEELTLDGDNLPPPGLSRLVLGQPEVEASQRMVTGTEKPATSIGTVAMDIEERHADGEDTSMEQMTVVPTGLTMSRSGSAGAATALVASTSAHIDISRDRNLYLVPGESNAADEPRVVTGVETTPAAAVAPLINEQREIELDGENLEDEREERGALVTTRNDPPLEGAASTAEVSPASAHAESMMEPQAHGHGHVHVHDHMRAHHYASKAKDVSNDSTSDSNSITDESGQLEREQEREREREHHHASKMTNVTNTANKMRKHDAEAEREKREKREKHHDKPQPRSQRKDKGERERDRGQYDSEGSATASEVDSSDREREREQRRGYREGSTRSDRDERERDYPKETKKRREQPQHHRGSEASSSGGKPSSERRSKRYNYDGSDELPSFNKSTASRRSGRGATDKSSGGDRSERDYDDYRRGRLRGTTKHSGGKEREVERERRRGYDDEERRERRPHNRSDGYDTLERTRRREAKRHDRNDTRNFEEYRKQSSRNARDSDVEKERGGATGRYDPRHMSRYGAYPFDPYAYYYEQMARTNPQAYAEWYKKFYGYAATAGGAVGAPAPGSQAGAVVDHLHPHQHHHHQYHHNSSAGNNNINNSSTAATDGGRDSVHSGRSSQTQNEKDRYTNAYITQVNEYRRHLHQRHQYQYQHQHQHHLQLQLQHQQLQPKLNSTMLDGSHNIKLNGNGNGNGNSNGNGNGNGNGNTSVVFRSLSGGRSTGNLLQYVDANQAASGSIYYQGSLERRAFMYADSDYGDSRSEFSMRGDNELASAEQERLTPCKFVVEHSVVSIAANILLTVKPKHTQKGIIANVVKMQRLCTNDATRRLFHHFAGPLVRGKTHKKSVIKYCEEQIRLGPLPTIVFAKQTKPATSADKQRTSHALLWNLLILLLRQNGMVVGTDIAELLLKNQLEFPYEVRSSPSVDGEEHDNSDGDADANDKEKAANDHDENEGAEQDDQMFPKPEEQEPKANEQLDTAQSTVTLLASSSNLSESEITDKFRNYLLYGNVNEALDWATDNNLWGHALFLASKVDRRAHANVMMKFANKLALNDPLQTLYQLMSGRSPSSVTSVQDERWGDWRPHLSMILSNTSQKPELDRRAITTLGDSLFNRGDLFGAHFCYLMAQVSFGRYQQSAAHETTLQQHLPKIILLGASHYKGFNEFATNEAIIMTLIYEYACSLNDEKFSLVELQPYKFLIATRMLDYGYHLKSLMYLEQIAQHIERDPSKYEPSFILKIYEFADRLKCYDPALERSLADEQPQGNTAQLNGVVAGSIPQVEEQKWLQTLRSIATQQALDNNTGATFAASDNKLQHHIDQQFVEINKQFNELNLQYATNAESTFYNSATNPQQQQQQRQQQHQELPTIDGTTASTSTAPVVSAVEQSAEVATNDFEQQQQQHQQRYDTAPVVDANAEAYGQQYLTHEQQQQHQQYQHQQAVAYGYDATAAHYGDAAETTSAPASYDYWAAQQQQQQQSHEQQQEQHQYLGDDENARPTISLPKSRTYDSDNDGDKRNMHDSSQTAAQHQQDQKQRGKSDRKNLGAKSAQQTSQNSGWFGGIWGKLSLKPKNQAILPDDKNPTIVWDAEKKRWVNTDGDEATEETLKPPPKMSDIMPQQQQYGQQLTTPIPQRQQPLIDTQQQHYGAVMNTPAPAVSPAAGHLATPISHNVQSYSASSATASAVGDGAVAGGDSAGTGHAKLPSLQSNMFKMQRNRTLKNSYVDVFNPSGAPMSTAADSVLAPALPPAMVPQGGYFIPGTVPADSDNQYQQQPQHDVPQFYNPNQFGASGAGY